VRSDRSRRRWESGTAVAGKSNRKSKGRTSGRGRPSARKSPKRPSGDAGSHRLAVAVAAIAVCGLLVGLNNAGVIPASWRDKLVIGRLPTEAPAPEPEPEPEPGPAPRPAEPAKPSWHPSLPSLTVPAAKPPKPVRQTPEPEAAPAAVAPAAEPAPIKPTIKQPARPAPPPPLAAEPAHRTDGVLTVAERRERLVDATPPPGFTSEWSGGAAVLRVAANEIARGNPQRRRVALTMDGCWEADQVPAILEILKSQGVHVTFFLTGTFASKYPDAVRKLAAAGHEVAHHSWDHPAFTKLDEAGLESQLERTERALVKLAPRAYKPYFRPPFGDRDVRVLRHLLQSGFLPVYWTVDTLDWKPEATPDSVLAKVQEKGLEPGAILLCHVASKPTLRVLPRLIVQLRAADLEPGPLSSVLVP